MSYGQRYRVLFDSFQSDVKIYINDTTTYTEDEVTPIDTDIEGHSFSITIDDTDESKTTPIRARKASLKILSNANVGLTNFVFGDDDRWYTEIYIDDVVKFKGYVIIQESSQEFLPNESRCIIELVATDNLGLLKNIALTRFDDTVPIGNYPIIDFIAWSLSKTTLELPIVCAMNIIEEDFERDTGAILKELYISAFAFEGDIGERINCYEVLTKILFSFGCTLTQFESKWWIIRSDEINDDLLYTCEFDYLGELSSIGSGVDLTKSIGISEDLWFSNGATTYKYVGAAKFVKQTLEFTTRREIIFNQDFSRGTFSSPQSGVGFEAYTPESWTYRKGWPRLAQDSNGYIKVTLDSFNNEDERYLHCPATTSDNFYYWEAGNRIPVHQDDKFKFGLDFKHSTDLGGGSGNFELSQAQIRLHGNDGTKWRLRATAPAELGEKPIWRQSNSDFTINESNINYEGQSNTVDFTEWQSVNIESAPIPVDGELEIFLVNNYTPDDQAKSFQNISFEYIPFIYGSYKKYKEQYHKVEQAGTLKSNVEQVVTFSDSPKQLFNGAILKPVISTSHFPLTASFNPIGAGNDIHLSGLSSTVYNSSLWKKGQWVKITTPQNGGYYMIDSVTFPSPTSIMIRVHKDLVTESVANANFESVYFTLAERWFNAVQSPDAIGLDKLGKHMIYALWNQYRREMPYFEYSIQGKEGETTIPDIINKFEITDAHLAALNKKFQMLTFEMQIKECEYTGLLAECYDSVLGNDYTSDHEFKYVSE